MAVPENAITEFGYHIVKICYRKEATKELAMGPKDNEHYISHEVRLRLLEKINKDINATLRWLLGIAVTGVLIPLLLHKFGV